MDKAEKLLHWVAQQYAGQLIKRTDEPYINHLTTVANMAEPAAHFGYEVGLCHDLFEDTKATTTDLLQALTDFGYTNEDARFITDQAVALTDVYTKAAFPNLKKSARKEKEAERLLSLSATAQTVKYCDLIYNIKWMIKHDQKHMKKYLEKKRSLLQQLTKGDQAIHQLAMSIINRELH